MTTSGVSTFNYSRDQIIRAALRKVGAIQAGEVPNAQLTTDCADQLNSMVKFWETSGIHIWTETEAILYTQVGQAQYPLGIGTPSNASTINNVTSLVGSVASGALTITVLSNFQISNGITIGVVLDNGNVFWTTVASFVGAVVTLAAATIDSATSGNAVYVVSPNIVRPLRIPTARRWNTISQIETPLIPLSKNDYDALPNKNLTGTVTQWYYNQQGGANNFGVMYLWPTPSDTVNNNIKFMFYRPIQDFVNPGDTPDLPPEWINTLVWNLAYEIGPEFGVPDNVWAKIEKRAMATLEECKSWDREDTSVYFGVDFSRMGS